MERSTGDAVTRRYNLDQISSSDFDGWDLGLREANKVCKNASYDGRVSDDQKVLLFPFEFDEDWLEANWSWRRQLGLA